MIHFYKEHVEFALRLIEIKSKYDDIKASKDVTEIKTMINIYQIEFATRMQRIEENENGEYRINGYRR